MGCSREIALYRLDSYTQMTLDHQREVQRILSDSELSPEEKATRAREARARHNEAYSAAQSAYLEKLQARKEAAQGRLYDAENPRLSRTEEGILREIEMRHANLRAEYGGLFDRGVLSRDPVHELEWAVQRGDEERIAAIAAVAPRFLKPTRRREFTRKLEEAKPESVRKAEKAVADIEAEERTATIAQAIRRASSAKRAENAGTPVDNSGGWNLGWTQDGGPGAA